MDWLVEESSLVACTFTEMEVLFPGARSGSRKVEVGSIRMRDSEVVTETTGLTRVVVPAFWKVRVTGRVSPAEMGFQVAERVTSTTGWGTASLARVGTTTLSDTEAWVIIPPLS